MRLHIVHETRYRYVPAVKTAQHMAHLRPLELPHQRVLSHALRIEPAPQQQTEARDAYGNTRAFFSLQSAHHALVVVADSLVETRAPAPAPADQPWEQVRERMRYEAGAPYEPAAEFVFTSPYAPRHDSFADYARPCFTPGLGLLKGAQALMTRIHTECVYDGDSTEVNTPALEALAQRRGVCQDFAHIMVACCRSLGLPARYVSGYLLTEPPPGQPRLVGADASHAWASVWLPTAPGLGQWIDFDPTNNRQPGEDYVTVATGRDYADVSPIRGVIHGGADHTLTVNVTVAPYDAAPQSQSQSQSQNATD